MVAIKAHEAERVLASRDPGIGVYLLYGPDHGLVGERAEHLARTTVADPSDPFQLIRMDGSGLSSDPLRLVDEANTIGLFGDRRTIWVAVGTKFPLSAIEPILASPADKTIVVLEAGDLAKTNPLRLAIERSRTGLAIPCYGDDVRSLDMVIDSVLREHGITIERDARQTLISRIGGDRRVSRREIEKLAIYVGDNRKAQLRDVEEIVGDASARDIDDIIDSVFGGAVREFDQAFQRLLTAGEDPGVVLGFVLRHAQALLIARQGIELGASTVSDAVGSMRGVAYPRRRAVEAALNRWPSPQLIPAITSLHAATAQVRFNPGLSSELATRALWNIALTGGRG
ncbi:MAG: DNA polymerase III subunit delta [Bosea sp. (in: a-proteobacteria)]